MLATGTQLCAAKILPTCSTSMFRLRIELRKRFCRLLDSGNKRLPSTCKKSRNGPVGICGFQLTMVNDYRSTTLGSIQLSRAHKHTPSYSYKVSKAALNMLTSLYAHECSDIIFLAASPGVSLALGVSMHGVREMC